MSKERVAYVALLASMPAVVLAQIVVDSTAVLVAGGVGLVAVGVVAHMVGRAGVTNAAPALWAFGLADVVFGLGLLAGAVAAEPWTTIAYVAYWAAYAVFGVWAVRAILSAR